MTVPGWVLGATSTVFVIGAIRDRQRQLVTDVERLVRREPIRHGRVDPAFSDEVIVVVDASGTAFAVRLGTQAWRSPELRV